MEDITYRAVRILRDADLIAAEDTRVSRHLLQHWRIDTPLTSLHARNEKGKTPQLIDQLLSGKSVAVISDAGTPGISDPGMRFASACVENGIKVEPVPGPSALTAALSASGLPTNRFWFEGFLPNKKGRQKRLDYLCALDGTVILYESTYRIKKLLRELSERLDTYRKIVVAREITKKYEEFVRGNVAEALEYFENNVSKGEFVVVISPPEFKGWDFHE
jgi:16S rRNA (cytidine1402-2'-O)-methyltransferase